MENGPFEDVFPIKHGDIPASYVSLPEGNWVVVHPLPTAFVTRGHQGHLFRIWCDP